MFRSFLLVFIVFPLVFLSFPTGLRELINTSVIGSEVFFDCLHFFFQGLSYSFASEAPDQAPREPTDGTDGRTPDLKVFSFFLGAGI